MKHLNKILGVLLAAVSFTACSDDNGSKPAVKYDVISFETAEGMLDAESKAVRLRDVVIDGAYAGGSFHNVLCGKPFMDEEDANGDYFDGVLFTTADKKIGFGSYFTNMSKSQYGAYDTWGGFTLSKNYSQTPTSDGSVDYHNNHFSAWTKSGANQTPTFAIAYVNGYGDYDYNTPKVTFTSKRKVASMYIANATVTAQHFSSREDFWFKVSVTGYLAGVKGRAVEQVLVSGKSITADWVKVDCTSLGEVDELRFDVTSDDMSGGFLNCPSYFCIDEIALEKQQ